MRSPYKGDFRVTQTYKGPAHWGLDLVGETSKNIFSTISGTVEAARKDTHHTGGMGLYIRIKENGTGRRHYFAHLSRALVTAGQKVSPGDWIGVEGSTGFSTGSHLHYEIRESAPPSARVDVAQWTGIPNAVGRYRQEEKKHWAEKHLDSLVKKGLIKSPEVHREDLDGIITRGQIFALLDRITD